MRLTGLKLGLNPEPWLPCTSHYCTWHPSDLTTGLHGQVPGLVHYIYIFGCSCPWRTFAGCKIHFTSQSCILLCCQCYCTALQQRGSAKPCGVVQGMELRNFGRGHHLYSAGWPSRYASAHILVRVCFVHVSFICFMFFVILMSEFDCQY